MQAIFSISWFSLLCQVSALIILCVDGVRERIYPVGGTEVSASGTSVHLEHEDQHLHR